MEPDMPPSRIFAAMLAAVFFALPLHAQTPAAGGGDALRSLLQESKDKNRGVAIYTNGVTVNAVIVSVDDKYVVGKNQQSSHIVIRLARIDGVAASF
jgi:sRNA-binding regulator protein Hfq